MSTPAAPTARAGLTLRDAVLFFAPIVFMANFMMFTHSIIHAFLARQPEAEAVLAGYSVAFAVFSALGAPIWTVQFVALSFAKDRRSFRQISRYALYAAGLNLVIFSTIAATPLADLIFGGVFGGSAAVVAEGRVALVVFALCYPFAGVRSIFYALIMQRRKTIFVTLGSAVRLGMLPIWLTLLHYSATGAVIGAAALALSMFSELAYCFIVARRYYTDLPEREGRQRSVAEIWMFSWPLMLNNFTESGVTLVMNLFLGRLADPDLALASFGVLWGITMVLVSPVRNIIQTVQTLVNTQEDARVMWRFTGYVGVIFSLIALLLFATPISSVILFSVMGLPANIANTVHPALVASFLLAVTWCLSAYSRGMLSRIRRTGFVAVSAFARVVVVGLIGCVALVYPTVNGAILGLAGLIGAFGSEAAVLGGRLFVLWKRDNGRYPGLPTLAEANQHTAEATG